MRCLLESVYFAQRTHLRIEYFNKVLREYMLLHYMQVAFVKSKLLLCFSLLTKHSIKSAILVQNPDDWKNIAVIGVNLTRIERDLAALQDDFPLFKITFEERSNPFNTKQFVAAELEKRKNGKLREADWQTDSVATIEMLVTANDRSRVYPRAKDPVYAVVAAHLVLDERLRQLYIDNCPQFALSYRSEVEGQTTKTSFAIRAINNQSVFDLEHPPLLCYRYHFSTILEPGHDNPEDAHLSQGMTMTTCPTIECPGEIEGGECHHIYLNDIALLRVKDEQTKEIQATLNKVHVKRHKINKLKRIKSRKQLEILCRRKAEISIGGASGHLIKFPKEIFEDSNEFERKKSAVHLPFILTSSDSNGANQ